MEDKIQIFGLVFNGYVGQKTSEFLRQYFHEVKQNYVNDVIKSSISGCKITERFDGLLCFTANFYRLDKYVITF